MQDRAALRGKDPSGPNSGIHLAFPWKPLCFRSSIESPRPEDIRSYFSIGIDQPIQSTLRSHAKSKEREADVADSDRVGRYATARGGPPDSALVLAMRVVHAG